MLCLDCETTGFAETVLAGSDHVEALAWLLGGLPGWLYCAWRHLTRTKACPECGSDELARETVAAAARRPAAAPVSGARVASRPGRLRWPVHLREPRERLRYGSGWLAAWLLTFAGAPQLGATLALLWVAAQWATRRAAPVCRAWDTAGRSLRIELA